MGVKKPLGDVLGALSCLRFAEFDRLESIDLSGTTPADLTPLMSVAGLRELTLAGVGLTDDSLASSRSCRRCGGWCWTATPSRGRGWPASGSCRSWSSCRWAGPALTDLFAKNLAGLTRLKKLSLAGATLTDAGVGHLKALTGLTTLNLRKTKVTARGIEGLKKALPECRIEWDGAEPKGK